MEITPTNQRKDNKTKSKIKNKKKSSAVKEKTGFAAELNKNITIEIDGTIDELLNDLSNQEKNFLSEQSLYELTLYKKLIKTILDKVLEEGFTTKTLRRTRKDRANFTVIQDINTKLLEITNAITRQNKAFNLLKSIDEIRGLIFDLIY